MGWGGVLYRSPFVCSTRLQPACLASACSMWSRKPMPVSMCMVWESEVCKAWVLDKPRGKPVDRSSRGPPSRLSVSWTLVSLVSRLMVAVRRGVLIVTGVVVRQLRSWLRSGNFFLES